MHVQSALSVPPLKHTFVHGDVVVSVVVSVVVVSVVVVSVVMGATVMVVVSVVVMAAAVLVETATKRYNLITSFNL